MSLFSLHFLALLLTALLLGGTVYFTLLFVPLAFRKLGKEEAGRLVRHIFPFYYGIGAVFSLVPVVIEGLRLSSLLLGLAGFGFLFALLWLSPAINRNRDRGLDGDTTAMATFEGLHRASVALNAAQILLVLGGFALLATSEL